MIKLNNNYIFYSILAVIISICTLLNYDANVMGPMVVLYEDFADFIDSGFDFSLKFKYSQYSFPMWGYGFVLYLFKLKLVIIIFQQLVTYFTLLFFDFTVNKLYVKNSKIVFRSLLIFSFPWFFFHTSLWPYSLGANLLILGFCVIGWFYETRKNYLLYISSICFGIMLNLRSDYYYYVILMFLTLAYLIYNNRDKYVKSNKHSIILSFILLNVLLIPWGVYTQKRVGHYLQTSTNAGHVFFISLGQLPDNIWKITQEDNDPIMYKELSNHFKNKANLNSLAYSEDKFLINKWKTLVLNNKIEFSKKCIYNIYRIIRTPFYVGNLETLFIVSNAEKNVVKERIKVMLDEGNIWSILQLVFFGSGRFYLVSLILNFFSISFFLVFIFYFLKALLNKLLLSNYLSLGLLGLILYQNLMSIFVFYMPIYNTNIYLIYLLAIIYFREKLLTLSKSDK
jgi:hypothetical protein